MSMNGGAVTMIYDGFGNRVSKTVGNVTTKYLVEDDVNPTGLPQVFEESVNGVVLRTYTYGLQRISENQVINNAWTTSFYGYDGFGSVRQLTNLSGTITDTYKLRCFRKPAQLTRPHAKQLSLPRRNSTTPTWASTTSEPDTTTPLPTICGKRPVGWLYQCSRDAA